MLVLVLKSDIDNGVCGDEQRCAIACAIERLTGKKAYVVDSNDICLSPKNETYLNSTHYLVIKEEHKNRVDEFITNFDHDKAVEPFAFECEIKEIKNGNESSTEGS